MVRALRSTHISPILLGGLLTLTLAILSGCATDKGQISISLSANGPASSGPAFNAPAFNAPASNAPASNAPAFVGDASPPVGGGLKAAAAPLLAQNSDPADDDIDELEEEWEDDEDWDDEDWEDEEDVAAIADPLMPFNWLMFHLNDNLYYGVLQPVAGAYKFLVPLPIRSGLKNFFTNLAFPIRFLNCLLQGKGDAAEREIDRFAMNTVVGVLGFGDPAKNYPELALNEEDFGQTLGVWGAGHGIYIVWPLYGPSSLRETVGLVGDIAVAPTTYLLSSQASLALAVGQRVNTLSFHIGDYEALKEAAFDPYSAFRDAYLQLRAAKLAQ